MKRLALSIAILMASIVPSAAQEPLKPVKLIQVQNQSNDLRRQFFGRVVARQTVDLAFQVGGQIVEFPAIEGEEIPQGGLVARLDTELFELTLNQAVLQKDQADRTLTRLRQLSDNTVSQVSIDDAETAVGLAEIAVRNAEYALEHATLDAPFDALVASRNLANFSTISAGTPVVRLHDMSELRIEIDVPEVLFQRAGEDPDVSLKARFPGGDQEFDLEVREFNAETSAVGQTFRLTLAMTPPEGMRVLPGSSVTVITTLRGRNTGVLIPPSALLPGSGDEVAVLLFEPAGADQGSLRRLPVEVSPTQNGGFIVTSALPDGAELVVTGGAALSDGQQVRRFTGFAD